MIHFYAPNLAINLEIAITVSVVALALIRTYATFGALRSLSADWQEAAISYIEAVVKRTNVSVLLELVAAVCFVVVTIYIGMRFAPIVVLLGAIYKAICIARISSKYGLRANYN